MEKRYRFTRKDFGELVFYPLHYDTLFDIQPERVRVTARQTYIYQGEQPTELISLNAHDLQIHSVELYTQHAPLGRLTPNGPRPDFVAHVESLKSPIPLHFTYREYDRYLDIHLPKPIQKGEEIVLRTISSCFPNDRELEGIYYDYTPSGAPQTMISQCQQYGFQRIMPCVDQMTSKLFYTTTLIADVRYTNIISTGDLAPGYFDPETNQARYKTIPEALGSEAGQLLPDLPEAEYPSRKVLKFQQHHTNMAPYLFFIGVGTYEVFHRQLEYPNGKQFELQLVCLPGEPLENATVALQSLHDSIQWVCVSCGPEAYDHQKEQQRIYELIAQRESIKEQLYGPLVTQSGVQTKREHASHPNREALEESLAKIRAELAQLISQWSETGYQYTGTVYREIAMENSLFGGMENVGNTTILASRLTPCEWMSDQMYQYMEKVKVHEFYHNINGSQVTGASPFELWLNEAVTVFIERARSAVLYGSDYSRLAIVQYAFLPMRGPLAQDRTAVSMAIEPAGFNATQELISSVTYSKAPEFVRMVELVISPRNFNRALENYHQKYAYSNATTQQWIAEMAAFSPPTVDLIQMAKGWLTRAGYPSVRVSNRVFDPEAHTISFEFSQTGYEEFDETERYPWIIPIDWALVKNGQVTHEGLFILSSANDTLKVSNVLEEPDYLSASRFWSFFGDISYDETAVPVSKRIIQARTDPDIVNRYFAVSAIITEQKAKVVANLVAREAGASLEPLRVSEDFVEMYERIFTDKTVSPGCRATLLSINDSLYGYPELNVHYKQMYLARVALLQAIFAKLHRVVYDSFMELVQICKNDSRPVTEGIQDRAFLILCYSILNAGLASDWLLADQVEIDPVVKNLDLVAVLRGFVHSPFMSLKQFAFKALMELKTLDENTRDQIREEIKAKWLTHLTGTEQFITFLSAVDSDRVLEYIRKLIDSKESPFCNLALAGHSRGITSGLCGNRKLALLTDEGLDFSVELFVTVGKVNQRMSYPFFDLFSDLPRVDPQTKAKWIAALTRMRDGIDPVAQEGLFNQLSILLGNQ